MLLFGWIWAFASSALAWENHQALMERLLDTQAAKQRSYPNQKISFPCPEDEKKELVSLGQELKIDSTKIPLFSEKLCEKNQKTGTILMNELIMSSFIDEPDQGMDQNLPPTLDPHHARKWMGGETGPTSQGFRHMYFSGVEWTSPLATFQLPLGAVGEALERIQKLRQTSDAYFAHGNKFWGLRTLLWELHYVQDLHQPFHVTQVPSMKMLPWKKLFNGFVRASTHAVSNYHYAYENLALGMINEAASNDFQNCFEPAEGAAFKDPSDLLEVPRHAARKLGPAVFALFGNRMKSDDVDLPNGIGQIDSFALLHSVEATLPPEDEYKELTLDEQKALQAQITQFHAVGELKSITCDLMKSLSRYTWMEFDRAFMGQNSNSSKSGK